MSHVEANAFKEFNSVVSPRYFLCLFVATACNHSQAKKMLKAKLPDRTDLNFSKLRLSEHEIAVVNVSTRERCEAKCALRSSQWRARNVANRKQLAAHPVKILFGVRLPAWVTRISARRCMWYPVTYTFFCRNAVSVRFTCRVVDGM